MDIVVQHAELLAGPGGEGVWKISLNVVTKDGTERQATILPADALEWRVAQFNVDAQTALEMLILEPYITDVTHQDLEALPTRSGARERKLKAMKDALAGGTVTWPTGKPQWMVGSGNEASKILDSGNGSARDTILSESPVDDEVIALKREYLDKARAGLRNRSRHRPEDGPMTPPPGGQRKLRRPDVTELRSRLKLDQPVVAEAAPSGPADVRRGRERR